VRPAGAQVSCAYDISDEMRMASSSNATSRWQSASVRQRRRDAGDAELFDSNVAAATRGILQFVAGHNELAR
jgi:hypothetical protein